MRTTLDADERRELIRHQVNAFNIWYACGFMFGNDPPTDSVPELERSWTPDDVIAQVREDVAALYAPDHNGAIESTWPQSRSERFALMLYADDDEQPNRAEAARQALERLGPHRDDRLFEELAEI